MRERSVPTVEEIELVGGRLCLDFANTANRLEGTSVDERLNDFADLAAWGRRCGLIGARAEAELTARAARHPESARDLLEHGVALRDALWRLFAQKERDVAVAADLASVNAALAMPAPRLAGVVAGSAPVFAPAERDLGAWLLHPVAASAAELLTSPARARVKSCPGDRCGWVFLDDSPSGRRRWCSMATCGNRRKASAHYGRRRDLLRD